MFKIDKLKDTYPWPVTVNIPNNGSFDKMTVKVTYNRLPHDERVRLLEQFQAASSDETLAQDLEADFFDKVFAGWEKGQIKDENGDVEDTAEGKALVLGITEFRMAVVKGYFDSIGGDAGKQSGFVA